LTAPLGGVLFLAAQQLGLSARFVFAPRRFGGVDHDGAAAGTGSGAGAGAGAARGPAPAPPASPGRVLIVALDEGALLAHLDLDGARLAGGVGLLDLAGGLLGQRDLLARRARAVAGLQVVQQLLLVAVGQGVGQPTSCPRRRPGAAPAARQWDA
jgi:hypothetical protein